MKRLLLSKTQDEEVVTTKTQNEEVVTTKTRDEEVIMYHAGKQFSKNTDSLIPNFIIYKTEDFPSKTIPKI